MSLVVFTARIGDTEPVRAPRVVAAGVRYLCFSDRPQDIPPPYQWVRVPATASPRDASRRIKILAEYPVLLAASATLWHDASYQLWRDPRWAERRLLRDDLVALRHRRACLEDEAVLIARYGYVTAEHAAATVARYRAEGFDGLRVTSGGLLGRRTSPAVRAFNRDWWKESQGVWGGRDQGSLDYCAWKRGLSIGYVQGSIRENRYAGWRVPVEELSRNRDNREEGPA
jgi:hypothetical protein